MATTTKITPTSTKHGYVDKAAYSYEGNIYIGKRDDGDVSRTRITLPSLRSNAAIGDNNISITKLILRMYRNNGGPVNATAKVSSSSAWNAAADGTAAVTISAKNGWYDLDLTSCAETILGYPGNWYIHLSGTGSRVMCNGISASSNTPYMNVVWEYSANTLTTDVESVELGEQVRLNIAPESGDDNYVLTYAFGDESGTIAETSNTSITWTPPVAFASEIPNAESGEVKITMRVYDSEGNQKRTEVLYLTVTVPESVVPSIANAGISLVNALGGYALTGKTYAVIAPVVNITAAYGATVKSVKAEITDGGIVQTITWDALNETDAGIFSGAAQATNILLNAGEAAITLTVTDSRDREVVQTRSINVQAYANPLITAFSVERYEPVYSADEQITGYAPSDTGEYVWVTLKASCSAVAGLNKVAWKLIANTASGESTYNGGGNSALIDITNDRNIISSVVSAASTVEYTVEVIDTAGYTAYQYDNVTPGRANFALAPSKFGASFGCLPKGTEENPMLESAYPFYAYGGIEGVNIYNAGEVKTGGIWTDGKPIYRQTFTGNGGANKAGNAIGNIPTLETVVDFQGTVVVEDYNLIEPIPSYRATTSELWHGVYFSTSSKNVMVASSFSEGAYFCLNAYYTKSTDEPGTAAYISGNPVSFRAIGGSEISPVTVLNLMQTGSGDPYPAGGGKNLYDATGLATKTVNGVVFTANKDGSITVKGTATAESVFGDGVSKLFEPGTYTVSGCLPGATLAKGDIYVYSSTDKKIVARSYEGVGAGATFTLTQQSYITMYFRVERGRVCNGDTFYPQIEAGSTATAFQPYSNIRPISSYNVLELNHHGADGATLKKYSVQLGRTICNGRFDWTIGKLTGGIPLVEFDGNEVTAATGGGTFTTTAFGAASEAYGEMWCSHYAVARDYNSFMNTDMSVCVWASGQVRIHDSRFSTADEINAFFAAQNAAGTPVQIAYKLATPIEVQLTAQQIRALTPTQTNTLYGDGDTIEVNYRR